MNIHVKTLQGNTWKFENQNEFISISQMFKLVAREAHCDPALVRLLYKGSRIDEWDTEKQLVEFVDYNDDPVVLHFIYRMGGKVLNKDVSTYKNCPICFENDCISNMIIIKNCKHTICKTCCMNLLRSNRVTCCICNVLVESYVPLCLLPKEFPTFDG